MPLGILNFFHEKKKMLRGTVRFFGFIYVVRNRGDLSGVALVGVSAECSPTMGASIDGTTGGIRSAIGPEMKVLLSSSE